VNKLENYFLNKMELICGQTCYDFKEEMYGKVASTLLHEEFHGKTHFKHFLFMGVRAGKNSNLSQFRNGRLSIQIVYVSLSYCSTHSWMFYL